MTLPPGIDIGLQGGKAPSQICDCMLGVELVADRSYRQSFSPSAHAGARLARIAREQGLLVRALPANNVIAFSPAFILDTQTVEETAALFARSLDSFARKIGSSSVPLRRARMYSTENGGRLLDLAGSATAKSQYLQVLSHSRPRARLPRASPSVDGKFAPGQKRTSRIVAQALATSDMPVRSAGLVQRANGTMTAAFVSRVKFKHVMEARALIESRAAELACVHIHSAGLNTLKR
jgi:hypothetical protein